jgi:hypothetical protein
MFIRQLTNSKIYLKVSEAKKKEEEEKEKA